MGYLITVPARGGTPHQLESFRSGFLPAWQHSRSLHNTRALPPFFRYRHFEFWVKDKYRINCQQGQGEQQVLDHPHLLFVWLLSFHLSVHRCEADTTTLCSCKISPVRTSPPTSASLFPKTASPVHIHSRHLTFSRQTTLHSFTGLQVAPTSNPNSTIYDGVVLVWRW